jgi:hypothetical protein
VSNARRDQIRDAALAYFDGLREKDFDRIPYAEQVELRAPLAPGGVEQPLVGRERVRAEWWAPLPGLLGRVEVVDLYYNDSLTGVVGEATMEVLLDPPVWLRVADRFIVGADGRIEQQVNHFDPRDVTNPGWKEQAASP